MGGDRSSSGASPRTLKAKRLRGHENKYGTAATASSPDETARFKELRIRSRHFSADPSRSPSKSYSGKSGKLPRGYFDASGSDTKHVAPFSKSADHINSFQDSRHSRVSQEYEIRSNVAQRSSRDNEIESSPPLNDNHASLSLPNSRMASVSPPIQPKKEFSTSAVFAPMDQPSGIFLQPETHPITEDQLVNEVRAIYAGLVMVEKKCIEIVKQQNEKPEELTGLQWQALTALHRTLLHEHHDFFLASNHPVASVTLKELAKTYSMPARMWRYGIHSFLELLRKKLPTSLEYMLTFIYMAYAMMTLLLESVPAFEETWIECLGDLARYRMAIEEGDMRDREIYTGVARYWYTKAADLNPDIGRIQHHLAVLARPNLLQQLFYYSKALISVQPFTNARDSILLLFGPLLDPARAANKYSKYYPRVLTMFVEAHGVLFTRQKIGNFLAPAEQFLEQLDKHAGLIGALFREQGVYIAAANYAAIFDFGHDDAKIPPMFNQERLNQKSKSEMLDEASRYWENPSCVQTCIDRRTPSSTNVASAMMDQEISDSDQVASFASYFAFTTLDIILERVGDNNTLPCVHVSLAFLWCTAIVPESMSYIQADVPWARIATFLNALIRPEINMSEIENEEEFPAHDPDVSAQLPEDFLIHGLCWSQLYYPSGFFREAAEDDDRSIELPSVAVPRTRRCLWLGTRIAKFKCWLEYDSQSRTFSATSFADDLAALSRQHQVLRRGSTETERDTDTSMMDS